MQVWTSFTPMERKLIAFVLAVVSSGLIISELNLLNRPPVKIERLTPEEQAANVEPLPAMDAGGRIDINKADKAALESLPGVGPSLADDIIAFRQKSGGFRSAEELDQVPGIGTAKLAKMEPLVTFGATAPAIPVPALPTHPPTGLPTTALAPDVAKPTGYAPVPRPLVNLNRATKAELESLYRVGPALAQRIIDYRSYVGGFRTVEQLTDVKGVGPVILQANRHLLTVH